MSLFSLTKEIYMPNIINYLTQLGIFLSLNSSYKTFLSNYYSYYKFIFLSSFFISIYNC